MGVDEWGGWWVCNDIWRVVGDRATNVAMVTGTHDIRANSLPVRSIADGVLNRWLKRD